MKTNTFYKLQPLSGSQFEVDCPPFLPSKELTAPTFWLSLLPLQAAVWQWVAIWYLSAPRDLPPLGHHKLKLTGFDMIIHRVQTP